MKFLIKLVMLFAMMATLQMVSGLLDPIDMIGRLTFASTTSNYRLMVSSTTQNYSYWAAKCEGIGFVSSKCRLYQVKQCSETLKIMSILLEYLWK